MVKPGGGAAGVERTERGNSFIDSIGGTAVRGEKGNVRTLSGAQKFRSKSEIVYDFLKLNILNGKLKSGERIAVSDVAKILGISGIPIREALTKLEAEGLVTITPHIGASVISIDKTKFEEIHVIRTELEGLATRLACQLPERGGF